MLWSDFKPKEPASYGIDDEISEINASTFKYLELIKGQTPPPPIEYQLSCGFVETSVYQEPIKELMAPESKESTPEYTPVPIKSLINSFEQGKLCFLTTSAYYSSHINSSKTKRH